MYSPRKRQIALLLPVEVNITFSKKKENKKMNSVPNVKVISKTRHMNSVPNIKVISKTRRGNRR